MKRYREEYETTNNSTVFRRCHKRRYARCDLCPWNRGENWKRNHAMKSWKSFRDKQYKPKRMF